MYKHADKSQEKKKQSIANTIQKKRKTGATFQFVDNRPEAVAQRKLQDMANNSPRVAQLKVFPKMTDENKNVIQAMFGKKTTAPIPDRLEHYESSMATTSAMILMTGANGVKIEERTFGSGGGLHAEEKVIQHLQTSVNDGTLVPQGTGTKDYILYLGISKSPCSSTSIPATRTDGGLGCFERLDNLNNHGLTSPAGVNVTFDVQLAATKAYSPSVVGGKNASRVTYIGFGGGGAGGGTFGLLR